MTVPIPPNFDWSKVTKVDSTPIANNGYVDDKSMKINKISDNPSGGLIDFVLAVIFGIALPIFIFFFLPNMMHNSDTPASSGPTALADLDSAIITALKPVLMFYITLFGGYMLLIVSFVMNFVRKPILGARLGLLIVTIFPIIILLVKIGML